MQTVNFTEDGNVAIITLNRPAKLNALDRTMARGLNKAFARFFAADHLRVALYRANGRSFSAGVDVTDVQAALAGADGVSGSSEAFDIAFEDAEFCDKPIIAAIQGQCFGFGFTSSMACDLRIAAEDATFCLPEVKLGLASVHGNIRLVQMAGLAKAMELLLTGQPRDAQWALDAGIVNELVPADALHRRALEYVRMIAELDPGVIRATRRVGYMSQYAGFSETVTEGLAMRARATLDEGYIARVTGQHSPAPSESGT